VVADDGVFLEEIVEDDAEFENFRGRRRMASRKNALKRTQIPSQESMKKRAARAREQ